MSPRSRRRPSNAPRPELSRKEPQARRRQQAAASSSTLAGTGIPEWNWKTTPVVLMFALGGLIGMFAGAASVNSYYGFLVFMAAFAMLFGLALGRVVRRWLAIRRLQRIRAG